MRQRGAALCGLQRVADQPIQPFVGADTFADQLEAPHHDGQQVVEIVRDTAGQLADCIHLLRLEQRLPCLLELQLGGAALGDVAGDLGEAQDGAIWSANRIDHDVCPEARAVLADTPAFLLEAALAPRGGQRLRGQAVRAILVGVEAREMLADDLLGRIALDALGARVPRRHVSGRIEHVDAVIGHALHQQPEFLLRPAQFLVGLAPLGEVARDLGEAHQCA